ncbi:MAG TPA: dsRBD fold-containing protein [Egibacteraceae bacterium]|nr:dsRBD fold-containing protein [Egibacteraceae bacterium]
MTTKTWTADIVFEETTETTDATVTVRMGNAECVAHGSARRNPSDPNVPLIGEELAAARAFNELSHRLVDESAQILEARLGRKVELGV